MDYSAKYITFLRKLLDIKKPVEVVFDASNGTAGKILRKLFAAKNGLVHAHFINDKLDGSFPAHGPDPMKLGAMDGLKAAVRKYDADLGVIFDADGDRAFFINEKSEQLASDIAAILLSTQTQGPVVLDVRAGILAKDFFEAGERKIITSRTGHSFIKKCMRENRAGFGAEPTGHYYFKDFFYADSGIVSAIKAINAVSGLGNITLSQWEEFFPPLCRTRELNFKVKKKDKVLEKIEARYKKLGGSISRLDGIRMDFQTSGGRWWFGVRASNTQNVLRLNLESEDDEIFHKNQVILEELIKKYGK